MRIQTATAWAAEAAKRGIDEAMLERPALEAAAMIDVLQLPGAANRPRGPRFGTLVHAVLATVPLDATGDLVERTAQHQGRIINASAPEVAAAAAVVSGGARPRSDRPRPRGQLGQARDAGVVAACRTAR